MLRADDAQDVRFGLSNSPSRFMFNGSVRVLLDLSDGCRIIDALATVRTLVKVHGGCGIWLSLTGSGYSFTNFLEILVAAVRAKT
jgi:hypothetical protein